MHSRNMSPERLWLNTTRVFDVSRGARVTPLADAQMVQVVAISSSTRQRDESSHA